MLKVFRYRIIPALLVCALLLSGCAGAKSSESPAETAAPTPAPFDGRGLLRVTELMSKNRATLRDEDGDFSDWIEIENISDETVSLEGWTLSDDEDEAGWAFPAVTLPARSRMLVFADGKDRRGESLHTDFSLSFGETVYLKDPAGNTVSQLFCPSDEADVSVLWAGEDAWEESLYPTPLYENSSSAYEALQAGLENDSPFVINEVVVSNFDSAYEERLGYCDYVEIKNVSSESRSLAGWYLSDDEDDYRLWAFPDISLAPGEYALVFCEDGELEAGYGSLRAPFALDSMNDELFLFSEEAGLSDFVSLRDIPYKGSYGRMAGEKGWFFFAEQSPMADNGEGCRRVSATPRTLYADGVFNDVETVMVGIAAEGKIYYTTDGSMPDESSLPYEGEFEVAESCVIRAISLEEGALPSRPLNLSYIINEGHSLPVISLVTDDVDEFFWMYEGRVKDFETPGCISLYEGEGGFTIPCGIKMHGETSLVLPKKSMSVRFRGAYGQDVLNYDLFGGGVTEFTSLCVRGGQDFYSGIIRNELCTNLAVAASDSLVSQRSKHCVLYINGQYSGIYTLLEKTNEQHYANLAGVSRESVTVMESEVPTYSEIYKQVFDFCRNSDMSIPENYERFCSMMDVDSLIDWIILQGVCANNDLTYGNLRYCRSTENDGKWRLVFYDLDSTFFSQDNIFHNVLSDYWLQSRQVSVIIASLLKSDEFKDRLLTRTAELLKGPLSNESILAELDRLTALVRPEVERDYARFGMGLEKWEWNIQWLRDLIIDHDWAETCEENLCELLDISEEQRQEYFG